MRPRAIDSFCSFCLHLVYCVLLKAGLASTLPLALVMGAILGTFCLLTPGHLQAQPSTQARSAQYVFVIDDSSSMSTNSSNGKTLAADPDRLSVFAVRSLLSMLDDTDEATLVRLNGPPSREPITPIAPLSRNRSALLDKLDLGQKLASYAGEIGTPCKATLEALVQTLNASHRPGVAQTIFFLTDGQCTGDLKGITSYADQIDAHKEDLFKFYLLRFSGRAYSRQLAALATKTGGEEALVSARDPTSILQPFANALSSSQGHQAYLLTPKAPELAAHSGARRVRLLAVSPDLGAELSIKLDPVRTGKKMPRTNAQVRTGTHQYADGRAFRYAAVDYTPGDVPVRVDVSGAGSSWKVVAVPEYRLLLDLSIEEGSCQQRGAPTQAVEVGASVCANITLVNEEGAPITDASMSHHARASLLYRPPSTSSATELPANQQPGQLRFTIERANLERGDHIFTPILRLNASQDHGDDTRHSLTLRGQPYTLQVSTRTVRASPSRLDLGEAKPGDEFYNELTLKGNFPSNMARISIENRAAIPECIHAELSGVQEGAPQKLTANQTYSLAIKISPYCGKSSFTRDIQTAVRIEFDRAANSRPIPSVVIPVHLALVSKLGLPAAIQEELDAGDRRLIKMQFKGNHTRPLTFKALLPPADERGHWPDDDDDLTLVFVDEQGKEVHVDGEPSLQHTITLAPHDASAHLDVRVRADVCCLAGTYRTQLALVSTSGSREVIRIPVRITVKEAGVWSCWGRTIIWTLLTLLVVLLLLYIANMFRQSHFLRRDLVAAKLVPLRWDDWREAEAYGRQADDIKRLVRKSLSFKERALNWLRANPLKFGLPGQAYHESAQLYLEPARDVSRSRLVLIPDRDLTTTMRRDPASGKGRIFVSARGGLSFFAIPDREGRLGRLQYQDDFGSGGFGGSSWGDEPEQEELSMTPLRRADLLDINPDREPGDAAGWRVG